MKALLIPADKKKRTTDLESRSKAVLYFVYRGFLVLLLFLGTGHLAPAFAFDFYGSLKEGVSGGEDADTTSSFRQQYKIIQDFDVEFTKAIKSGVGVYYTWNDSKQGSNDYLSTNARLSLNNDIFGISFSGRANKTRTTIQELDYSNWRVNLSPRGSTYKNTFGRFIKQRKYWPKFRFFYGESQSQLTNSGINRRDDWRSDYGGNVEWILPILKLEYRHNTRITENKKTQYKSTDSEQYARITTNKKFLEDRLFIKFSQTAREKSLDTRRIIPDSGIIEQELELQTYALLDPEPDNTDCVEHELDLTQALEPGLENQETTTLSVAPGQSWHFGVSEIFGGFEKPVNSLRVYVDDPFGNLVTDQGDLQWDIYASNDNINWYLVACDTPPLYNSIEQRFEVDIPELEQSYQYLKVVVSNQSDLGLEEFTLSVRAIEAINRTVGTPGRIISQNSDTTSYRTNLDMRMQITRTLKGSSVFDMLSSEGRVRQSLSTIFRWQPYSFIAPSFNFRGERNDSGSSEAVNYNYGLQVPITLLPTLFINLGANRLERLSDSEREYLSDRYLLNVNAILYPDLTAQLSTSYNTSTTFRTADNVVERKTLSQTLGLAARLTPRLTCNLDNIYSKTYLPESATQAGSSLKLNYHPSTYLLLSLDLNKEWVGEIPASLELNLQLGLLNTFKTRVTSAYNYKRTETTKGIHDLTLSASWDISRIFTLKSNATYSIGEKYVWSFLTSLYVKF